MRARVLKVQRASPVSASKACTRLSRPAAITKVPFSRWRSATAAEA